MEQHLAGKQICLKVYNNCIEVTHHRVKCVTLGNAGDVITTRACGLPVVCVCAWSTRGMHMVCMWSSCGLHVVCMWYVYVVCMRSVRCLPVISVRGLSVVFICGIHVVCLWSMYMVCTWSARGLHIVCVPSLYRVGVSRHTNTTLLMCDLHPDIT